MRTVLSLLLIAAFLQTCLNVCSGIIGGREAKPHSRPYMAIVHSGKFCGGILIKDDWILTAAHCILTENKTTVTLGAHYGDQGSHLQIIDVKRSITHEHFNWTNYHNDIQLLQLANKAKLGKYVNYTVLPKTYEDVADGTVCETAGWGKTEHSRPADKLMEVNVTILDRKQCSRKWKKYQITNEMLCTIVGPERKDVRKEDAGGPLICNGVLRGITSFGVFSCDQIGDASFFSRLTEDYLCWIYKVVSKWS
ncbi:mast cell protease 1A-like isoform X2 [Rana temporaria]|uniref:mast cell protease 1A-like isoform X2 n=1 Tax=Rana temporaria TaxID=8407 RepID=UPI001AACA93A|nr:mast cell protease 1A-like isoform X2 [Rana temporaria]